MFFHRLMDNIQFLLYSYRVCHSWGTHLAHKNETPCGLSLPFDKFYQALDINKFKQ
jgi:hypothetical protein